MGENKRKLVKKEYWLAVLFVVLGIIVLLFVQILSEANRISRVCMNSICARSLILFPPYVQLFYGYIVLSETLGLSSF